MHAIINCVWAGCESITTPRLFAIAKGTAGKSLRGHLAAISLPESNHQPGILFKEARQSWLSYLLLQTRQFLYRPRHRGCLGP